jgi:hypothetical protein
MWVLLVMLLMGALMAGCSSFVKNTYSTIDTVRISVDTAMKVSADLYDRGIIGDEEKASILEIHAKYRAIHQSACEFLKMYKNLSDKEQQEGIRLKIEDALQGLLALSIELTDIVSEYLSRDTTGLLIKEVEGQLAQEIVRNRAEVERLICIL